MRLLRKSRLNRDMGTSSAPRRPHCAEIAATETSYGDARAINIAPWWRAGCAGLARPERSPGRSSAASAERTGKVRLQCPARLNRYFRQPEIQQELLFAGGGLLRSRVFDWGGGVAGGWKQRPYTISTRVLKIGRLTTVTLPILTRSRPRLSWIFFHSEISRRARTEFPLGVSHGLSAGEVRRSAFFRCATRAIQA
jgi:hypothetical protein